MAYIFVIALYLLASLATLTFYQLNYNVLVGQALYTGNVFANFGFLMFYSLLGTQRSALQK